MTYPARHIARLITETFEEGAITMKLKDAAGRFWGNIEAFAHALAYDERDDIEARIRRLEVDGQSQQARLLSLSEQVQSLSEQIHRPASQRG